MSNRAAIIASAVIAGCVSIFSITSMATAEPAAESAPVNDCLAAPKPETPAGAHWYYRLEKGTKRKCWYLSDAGGKLKKTTTPKPTAAAEEGAPPASKPMQKTVANARAELAAGSSEEDPTLAETTWPPLTPSADATIRQDNQSAEAIQPAPEPAARQGWNIVSRWPEPSGGASAEAGTNAPAANATPPNTPAPASSAPALTPDRLAAAAPAAPTPAATPVAAIQPATTTEPAESETFSIRVLLALLVCLLALAAVVGPMIFKYVRPRRRAEQPARNQRRPIWDANMSGEAIRQHNPRVTSPALYADTLPEPRVLDETTDEIEELLARASRRSAA